ncbi:MAG: hypothetical protein WC509_03220 [Candidatus Izemoplasmatales bacterium]
MSVYGTLTKTLFRINFSPRRILGTSYSDSKGKRILIAVAILYVVVAYWGGFGYLFYDLARTLSGIPGMIESLLFYVYIYAIGTTVMIVFFRADAMLFRFADFSILGPLPIKARTLVAAKTTVIMANVYVTALLATAPIAFGYFAFAAPGIAGILLFLPSFLAAPLLPAVAAALLALGIHAVTDRLPKSRTLNTILMFAFFLGIMMSSFSFTGAGEENPLLAQSAVIAAMGARFWPMGWFAAAVHEGSLAGFALLFATGAVPFAGFVVLLSRSILKTNARSRNDLGTRRRKALEYRSGSAFKAMLAKEWRTFVGIQMYVFNAGFGPVILVVASVASLFFADKVMAFLTDMTEGAVIPTNFMIFGFIAFAVGMVYTSAVSLSIEGKRLWIVKSLPVSPSTVIDAKLWFNVLLGSIPGVFALVLFAISFAIPPLDAAAMAAGVLAFSFLTSAIGSIVNLRFPKFQFHHEVEVVKQSLGALIGVFGGFGVAIAAGFAIYGLGRVMPWQAAVVVVALLAAGIGYALRLRALRLAENLFIRYNA